MKLQNPPFIKIAILGFCAILLTGCSNSLSSEEAIVSIDVDYWNFRYF